jgi:hypothetical protein
MGYIGGANISQTGVGATAPFNIAASYLPIFTTMVGLIANVVSGAPTYSVQVTGDSELSPDGNWVEHDKITFVTTSMTSNIAYPVTGLRLVIHSGTGTVNLGIARWPLALRVATPPTD